MKCYWAFSKHEGFDISLWRICMKRLSAACLTLLFVVLCASTTAFAQTDPGVRLFFLHDGRTSNLITAINTHGSNGSEANRVISNFQSLTASQRQDLLNFLRSL